MLDLLWNTLYMDTMDEQIRRKLSPETLEVRECYRGVAAEDPPKCLADVDRLIARARLFCELPRRNRDLKIVPLLDTGAKYAPISRLVLAVVFLVILFFWLR